MSDKSKIEWTDATWTPVRARNRKTGKVGWHCEHATPGCVNCYAEGFNERLGTGLPFKPGHRNDVELFLDEQMLLAPLRWKKPRMVFVCSMTDLFADFVPDEWIDRMFAVMALAPQHTFQVLTKRAARMRTYFEGRGLARDPRAVHCSRAEKVFETAELNHGRQWYDRRAAAQQHENWPLPNVWLGVSTEDKRRADERIPHLLATPAAVRFISAEPLLRPIDLTNHCNGHYFFDSLRGTRWHDDPDNVNPAQAFAPRLDWVIVGGESGTDARPMHPDWARSLRDQCAAAGVPFFFKQWGAYLPVGQSLRGCGKVHGATAVKPGRMKLHYGGTPQQAPKHAFAERGVKFASTADGRLTFRVGKKAAGRLLDGVEHNGMPRGAS